MRSSSFVHFLAHSLTHDFFFLDFFFSLLLRPLGTFYVVHFRLGCAEREGWFSYFCVFRDWNEWFGF